MIYWNQQENPNLDFDRWDYSGIGDNTEEAFSFKIKKCKPGNENEFIAYFKEFKKCLDEYEIPYSVDYIWDSYDIMYELNSCAKVDSISITLYYPEIKISNGKQEEILNDLYFSIKFNYNGKLELCGNRETYSEEHYIDDYTHSHLPRNCNRVHWFVNFCLGSGVLQNYRSIINSSSIIRLDCVKNIIMNIKPYLEWESESGGPYMRMSSLGIKDLDLSTVYEMNFDFQYFKKQLNVVGLDAAVSIIENIDFSKLKFKLDFSNNLRLYKLVINTDFINELELQTKLFQHLTHSYSSEYKFINDKLYKFDNDRIIDESFLDKPIFIRNHEIITRKLLKSNKYVNLKKGKIYILPRESYLRKLIFKLEYIFNYNAQLKIKNYGINNDGQTAGGTNQQQVQEIK
jgi:hypothetical protein